MKLDELYLNYTFPTFDFQIKHGDKVALLGSCFSDEVGKHFQDAGHHVMINPFGTIFHPNSLAQNVLACFDDNYQERILERDDRFYSWDCSTKVVADTFEDLEDLLKEIRQVFAEYLREAKLLIVTFGTAWGYELTQLEGMVANCHKAPADYFQKFLSSPYEMVQDWSICLEKLKEINPELQVVFTVSPVRHVRDGLVENSLSKARLIEVTQQLSVEEKAYYFASYEYLMDVLRDYRFYKSDGIHPSEQSVSIIWERFQETAMNLETRDLNSRVTKYNRYKNHLPISSDPNELERRTEQLERKKMELLVSNPNLSI